MDTHRQDPVCDCDRIAATSGEILPGDLLPVSYPVPKCKLIRNEADYARSLEQIDRLIDAAPDTPEAAELECVSESVLSYVKAHHALPEPDPAEAVRFRREQMGEA